MWLKITSNECPNKRPPDKCRILCVNMELISYCNLIVMVMLLTEMTSMVETYKYVVYYFRC